MSRTDFLSSYLSSLTHNNPRLLDWLQPGMELQALVDKRDWEPVDNSGLWEHPGYLYPIYDLRVPKNAGTDPIDNDSKPLFPAHHIEAVGMTGWNYRLKRSVRVGFDFDAIEGHARGVGISDEQLEQVREKLTGVPEALILRSTGGQGLHVYIEFDPDSLPETANWDRRVRCAQ